MTSIRFTYDIQTQEKVYVVVKKNKYVLTNSITNAIRISQNETQENQ